MTHATIPAKPVAQLSPPPLLFSPLRHRIFFADILPLSHNQEVKFGVVQELQTVNRPPQHLTAWESTHTPLPCPVVNLVPVSAGSPHFKVWIVSNSAVQHCLAVRHRCDVGAALEGLPEVVDAVC
jgi:hypothetical protein